jgi:hypothetical protein
MLELVTREEQSLARVTVAGMLVPEGSRGWKTKRLFSAWLPIPSGGVLTPELSPFLQPHHPKCGRHRALILTLCRQFAKAFQACTRLISSQQHHFTDKKTEARKD